MPHARAATVLGGAAIRVEVAKQIGDLRAEISGVTRQMYVALLGQTAVMLGRARPFDAVELDLRALWS